MTKIENAGEGARRRLVDHRVRENPDLNGLASVAYKGADVGLLVLRMRLDAVNPRDLTAA
jgi:hypothetical protein